MSPTTVTEPDHTTKERTKERTAPRWNVVLLDDDDHTYEYVIEMLQKIFGHTLQRAYALAVEVDTQGRVIVYTGTREVAEHKQERIHTYGADPRLARSAGSMTAVLELAD